MSAKTCSWNSATAYPLSDASRKARSCSPDHPCDRNRDRHRSRGRGLNERCWNSVFPFQADLTRTTDEFGRVSLGVPRGYRPMVSQKLSPTATQTASRVAAIPHGVFVLPPTGIVRTTLVVTGSISETEAPASQTEPAPTARKLAGSRFETEVRLTMRCG